MFVIPCIPVTSPTVTAGREWHHQPKLDGWRCQVHRIGRHVRIFTRGGHDVAERLPTLSDWLRALPAGRVVDGELVLPTDSGVDFHALTRSTWPGRDQALAVMAFDVLRLRGRDVRGDSLEDRLQRLRGLLQRPVPCIALVEAYYDGAGLLHACEAHGHEGVVSMRRGSRYTSGGCSSWRKVKTEMWRASNVERWGNYA